MNMVPLFKCRDMKQAIAFYTRTLDFVVGNPEVGSDSPVVALRNGNAWLILTTMEGDQKPGINANVAVEDIDSLYRKYVKRGLKTDIFKESPVHQAPVEQTWGTREFYVTDPDGNTLRFMQV